MSTTPPAEKKTKNVVQSKQFFGELDTTRSDTSKMVAFYNGYAKEYNECLHDSGYTDTTDYCSMLLKKEYGKFVHVFLLLDLTLKPVLLQGVSLIIFAIRIKNTYQKCVTKQFLCKTKQFRVY